MLKEKRGVRFLGLLLTFLCLMQPVSAQAAEYAPYDTYTYSLQNTGNAWYSLSPHAYVPKGLINGAKIGLDVALKSPADLAVDGDGNVYIADTGNNRIVVLDSEYGLRFLLVGYEDAVMPGEAAGDKEAEAESTESDGAKSESKESAGDSESAVENPFKEPKAVFVTPDGKIYVGDTMNGRIAVFGPDGKFLEAYEAPEEAVLQDVIYEPSALVVDEYDRIYVISQSSNMGVLSFSSDGVFQGFIGAEKTKGSFWDIVRNFFRSEEQKARMVQNVPTEFNNITIDDKGFLYVTTSTLDTYEQYNTMVSKTGTAHPIKRLNPAGTDVLKRNGVFGQGGDLFFRQDVSRFVDVALTEDDVYSVLDSSQGKIFTYDAEGNLMYIFGGMGTQLGVFQRPSALAYKGTDLLVLDSSTGEMTVFERTAYGDLFSQALHLQGNRKYTEAAQKWQELIKLNGNYEQAYNNIGTSYMRMGMYEEAMLNYKNGNDLDGYRDAYNSYRKGIMEKYILWILLAVAAIVAFISWGTKRLKAANATAWTKHGKYTLREELCYGWYVIFHPFDGFYELKRERRGTMKGAMVIFIAAIAEQLFRGIATGYIVTGSEMARVSIVDAFMSVGFLALLWTVANWCFTTLMDGKGRMRDIFIATCYALIPMVMFGFPCTIVTNFCTESELQFVNFFYSLGTIWTFALIFLGALVVNEYSLLKNVLTTFLTLVGMAFIAFIGILGVNLFTTMFGFIRTLANEIIYRM